MFFSKSLAHGSKVRGTKYPQAVGVVVLTKPLGTAERIRGYRCVKCGANYQLDEVTYTCPVDGENLDLVLNAEWIRAHVQPDDILNNPEHTMWRYLPLLPVEDPGEHATTFRAVGGTPTFKLPTLAKESGVKWLWAKDESRNPTASFKDRASALVVARAREIGARVLVTASTGNAGAALAGMAAAVHKRAVIFAPKNAPPAKIAQLLIYGAQVFLVRGTYDDACALSLHAAQEFEWYCRNTGYNPYTLEGKKTAGYEIWEWWYQNYREHFPFDALSVVVSVGDGNIISGIHKGLYELKAFGWIDRIPRIIGVQSEKSAAIANAFEVGTEVIHPVNATTLADSISVDMPRDGLRALRAATQTGGAYIKVSDQQILDAVVSLGRVGVFSEPAAAASYAGVVQAVKRGLLTETDPVLVMNTGSGLKDVASATKAVEKAVVIKPTLLAVKRALRRYYQTQAM